MKEKRAFPRYPITFPVKLGLKGGDGTLQYKTECVDVSRSSIQISCESQVVNALLSQEEYPHMVHLDFTIPGDRAAFAIIAQVVTHRRLSQNQYYLVLVFNEFETGSDEQLANELKEFEPNGLNLGSA